MRQSKKQKVNFYELSQTSASPSRANIRRTRRNSPLGQFLFAEDPDFYNAAAEFIKPF